MSARPAASALALRSVIGSPPQKTPKTENREKNHNKIKRNLFFFLSCSVVLYSLFKEYRTPHIISVYRCIVFSQYIPMPEPIIDTKSMLISITIAWRMYLPSTLCPVPGNSHVNCLINASINKKKILKFRQRQKEKERETTVLNGCSLYKYLQLMLVFPISAGVAKVLSSIKTNVCQVNPLNSTCGKIRYAKFGI